jgi:hypothetical protein
LDQGYRRGTRARARPYDRVPQGDGRRGRSHRGVHDGVADRIAPNIATARRGVVYAHVGKDNDKDAESALILDARTGQDKITDLPFSPDMVVPGFALMIDTDLVAYRSTG